MATSADLLLDTSAAIALVRDVDPAHEAASARTQELTLGLSGHALFETYSVLTRMPGPARISPDRVVQIIERTFPGSVALKPRIAIQAVSILAEAGVAGGSVYDGLVALAARESGVRLLSCDRRALPTYQALGVDVEII